MAETSAINPRCRKCGRDLGSSFLYSGDGFTYHSECYPVSPLNAEIESLRTALAVERERAEEAENEVERLREGVTIAARETLKAIGQRNKECSRAEAAEASLAEARALMKPFADLALAIDELAAAGQRKLQPEESADLSDGEIAELVTPGSNIIATDGRMAFGHAAPIGKPVAITVNDARAAARFLAQEEGRG